VGGPARRRRVPRRWLAEHCEEVAEHPGDQAWLTVEAFTAASTAFPPELTSLLLGEALGDTDAGELAENLALMSALVTRTLRGS